MRKLSYIAGLVLLLTSCVPARAQDEQPSLADAARQARKEKDKTKDKDAPAPKTVITEDSLSGGGAGASGLTPANLGALSLRPANSSSASASSDGPIAKLRDTEAALDRLQSFNRAQLSQMVLNGNSADFPNRGDWEIKLFSAKTVYVARSRQLVEAMKEVLADLDAVQSEGQGRVSPDDPRVQELTGKAQQIMQLAARTESAFQAVVTEGQNLARPSPPHH